MTDIVTKTQTQGKRGPKMAKFVSQPEAQGELAKLDNYQPSEKMVNFAEVLFSEEVMGNISKACEKAGVNRQAVYQLHDNNPKFRHWFLRQRERYLALGGAKIDIALMSLDPKVVPSVRTYYEKYGWIGPRAQHKAPVNNEFKVTIEGEMPEELRETQEAEAEVIDDGRKD